MYEEAIDRAQELAGVAFVVKQERPGQPITIEWHIAGVEWVTDFILWASRFGAMYKTATPLEVRPRSPGLRIMERTIELVAIDGCGGEYERDLYFSLDGGCPWRRFGATHYLTQHGLDAMPARWLSVISSAQTTVLDDIPLFFCFSRDGTFVVTYSDWMTYFASGRNSQDLTTMAADYRRHR